MRALVATMDMNIGQSLGYRMTAEAMRGEVVDNGAETVQMLSLYDYDVAVFDERLSDMSGMEALRRMRAGENKTPILLLGADDITDKIAALDIGADDYVTKPFHADELIARVRAVVRRSKGHAKSSIAIGDLVVDLDRKIARIGKDNLHLTGKEYQMLELLALRRGMTITKEMFLNHLYGGMDEPELKIIDVFICKLRRKMSDLASGRNYIETVWGRGYVLREPEGCGAPPRHRPVGTKQEIIEQERRLANLRGAA